VNKIKARKRQIVNEETLIVAVDIGKTANTGYCRSSDGKEIKPFEFSNNLEGFERFWDRICWAKTANHLEQIVVGFESTGSYGEPLVHYLMTKPVRLVQVNPMHTKRVKDLEGNSPGKTDRKDPRVIADIIELGHALSVVIPQGVVAELRRLTHARQRAVERKTVVLNQLQDLVFILFPEFLSVMNGVGGRTARYLLQHHPSPGDIIQCGLQRVVSILRRVSRGQLTKERAQALYRAAGRSVGIKEGTGGILLEIEEVVSVIEASEEFIKRLEHQISYCLEQIPYRNSILSLKGIGEVTAAGLIGEVGDFRNFRTLSEVTKMAGLDLFEISSGKHKGARRISKRGRPLLRKLLFFAAINTVRKGGVMHLTYQRYLQRGMPKIKALVAISRKLLRIVFAVVRDHSTYTENYSNPRRLKLAA
jgi:transposase